MPASNYVKQNSLDLWLRNQSKTPPVEVWVALYTTDPTAADTGVEASGGSYARKRATFSTPTISGDKAIVQNASAITFDQLTSSIGTATHVGLRDAQTGGNLLFYEALTPAVPLNQGYTPYWSAGDLKVSVK